MRNLIIALVMLVFATTLFGQSQTELKKILPIEGSESQFFGRDVKLFEDKLVVGSGFTDIGAAYVFYQNEGGVENWGQIKKIQSDDISSGDRFGWQVAMEDDMIFVSAAFQNNFEGAVYIFYKDLGGPDNWGQLLKLTPDSPAPGGQFGSSIAVHNQRLVVGADRVSGSSSSEGAAYIFEKDAGGADNWGQVKKLTASDAQGSDLFGRGIDIYNNTIVVGAVGDDDIANESGAAYIFEKDFSGSNNWGEVVKIVDPGGSDFAGLGAFNSVAIYNDILVLGAYQDDSADAQSGVLRVHSRNQGGNSQWGFVKEITTERGDRLGYGVDIQRDFIIGGAIDGVFTTSPPGYIGGAYVFNRNTGGPDNWGLVTEIVASDPENFSTQHAQYVSLYDDRIVGSAILDDDNGQNSGSVYVYDLQGNIPPPTASFTIANNGPVDLCPGSVVNISFNDTSSENPTSWMWTFSGAGVSPTTSTLQNPTVNVSLGGNLTATLVVSNNNGSSEPLTQMIAVNQLPANDPICQNNQGNPCLDFQGGFYRLNNITPNCATGCQPVFSPVDVWSSEAYLLGGLTGGETYTFDICDGYDPLVWEAVLTIGSRGGNGIIPNSQLAWTTGCTITFNCPSDGDYVVVISDQNDCGGPEVQVDNGIPRFQCAGLVSTSVFTDPGGVFGNYSNDESIIYTLCSASEGDPLEIIFTSFDVEGGGPANCYDLLNIYNGNSISAPPIGSGFCNSPGAGSPGTVLSSNSSDCLTLEFTSDESVTRSGWVATVSCGVSNCPSNYTGPNQLTGIQATQALFETNGPIDSDQTIDASVDYDSAIEINLLENFEVKAGRLFHAYIDGCGN